MITYFNQLVSGVPACTQPCSSHPPATASGQVCSLPLQKSLSSSKLAARKARYRMKKNLSFLWQISYPIFLMVKHSRIIHLKLDSISARLQQAIDGHDILSEMSVCSPPTLSCLNRNCDHCGVENVEKHIKENLTCASTMSVKWQSWDMVMKENGQRQEKVGHEGTFKDHVSILMRDLTTYSKHVFAYRWHFQQYKALLAKLPSLQQTAVVLCDFAENYLCRYQNEVHSAHRGYSQVTVHPCVMFYPFLACRELVSFFVHSLIEVKWFTCNHLGSDGCFSLTEVK